jgi:phospholipid/cholesterol/gamma-HCH transport system substrate-binding protein
MKRLLGLAFVALLAGALSVSVLQYRKAFTPVLWVTLYTDSTGLQLSRGADVKLHGVTVGEVREIGSDGSRAGLRLALDPALARQVPADVSARLLPRTLFGERYVSLVRAPGAQAPSIRDGAVITQDRSESAVELERVLDGALPLLQSIQPDKLAATLGALATALDGRGRRLADDLAALEAYLAALNEQMPLIAEDVRRLATVLDVYDGALPDLLALLRDAAVTASTVVDQRQQLALFLDDTTTAADATRLFLDRHGDQLIRLGDVSRPVLEVLATYAPEYPCLLRGLVALRPRAEQTFAGGQMHITLEIIRDNGKYRPGRDEPVYGARNGPNCHGLPDPAMPAPEYPINDGYDYGAGRVAGGKLLVGTPAPSMGIAGTAEEKALVKPIIAAAHGVPPVEVPDIAVLLWGPLLRGALVGGS